MDGVVDNAADLFVVALGRQVQRQILVSSVKGGLLPFLCMWACS